jgi:GNAT superfamily N-acetyltransferase
VTDARREQLEDWLAQPVLATCRDERFEIRRATPDEYPAIRELLGEAFGTLRNAELHDWLYRKSPNGYARCWITLERATGALVANETRWPWPLAWGRRVLRGEMIGDAAVATRFQRQGVGDLRAPFRTSHPWYADTAAISWPNEASRQAANKHGYGDRLQGPIPSATRPLELAGILEARLPASFEGLRRCTSALGKLRLPLPIRLRHRSASDVGPVARFDSSFDSVTAAFMPERAYWSPRTPEFLNWRYLEHPVHEYVALAATSGDEAMGYTVIRLENEVATLMEFTAPIDARKCRAALLAAAFEVARDAGCKRLTFFSPDSWPHWPFLRRAGFVMRPSDRWLQARGPVKEGTAWQLVPGDTDFL